jgi:hypothetical protein
MSCIQQMEEMLIAAVKEIDSKRAKAPVIHCINTVATNRKSNQKDELC